MKYLRNPQFAEHIRDGRILKLLDIIHGDKMQELHEATQRRVKFFRDIATLAEDGQIALVESGRDCDGVEYSGHVRYVKADKKTIEDAVNSALDCADGPMYFALERPSVARTIQQTSRDRTMEAFENGSNYLI